MPFSCLIVNLLILILKGAKGEGERDYISVREQKLPENKVGMASPELMGPRRTREQKTLCAALGWCSTPLLCERGTIHCLSLSSLPFTGPTSLRPEGMGDHPG